jgi:hypothetical protein
VSMINFFMSNNSDYADVVSKWNNIYLSSFIVNWDEDVAYSFWVNDNCKRIFNSTIVSNHSENTYFSLAIYNSFKIFYSKYINNSSDIWFSANLLWCKDCIFCNDLENVSYYIENVSYEKEEYKLKLQEILKNKDKFHEYYLRISKIQWKHLASENTTWAYAVESYDVEQANFSYRIKNWRNVFNVWWYEWCQNIYDVFDWGGPTLQDIYGVNGIAIGSENCYLSCHIPNCNTVFYSYSFPETCKRKI